MAREGDRSYRSTVTDDSGAYELGLWSAGRYVVGISFVDAPWKNSFCGDCDAPPLSLYYPAITRRSDALSISLTDDEHRRNIDFVLPN
jgi:hypothetical protein